MSDVKRLLDEATPLPWQSFEQDGSYYEVKGLQAVEGTPTGYVSDRLVCDSDQEADAALIVYAVNHLPDYEAAVEALEELCAAVANTVEDRYLKDDDDPLGRRYQVARAALRRLRGEPADVR